jgi:YVTN family beta-propeller protein
VNVIALPTKSFYGLLALALALFVNHSSLHAAAAESPPDGVRRVVQTVPGMPPVTNPDNLYSETARDKLSATVANHLSRIYVPNRSSNDVWVIDPATGKVIKKFRVGVHPQHVVPSWDLKTLWVNNNAEGRSDGSVTPIDPVTGKAGKTIPVDDPYNMYFTPDGSAAIIVAEARKRLDFRDPHTMAMKYSIDTPNCAGINHADFSIDGRYGFFTCEYAGSLVKIDLIERKLSKGGMPQDIRIAPDGMAFYIADMKAEGVFVVDADKFIEIGHIKTGLGAHGLYPSRDGKQLYVANRGVARVYGPPKGKGSVSVIDFATRRVTTTWPIPGGGSPDMGNLSVDGNTLWLSGRYDNAVYSFDTTSGGVKIIPVKTEPHGLTVWPQPGRYSLGHTGNLR